MAEYPAALKTFTTKENNVDIYDADHINDIQDEVTAIETELGTDVAGSAATLKARLAISLSDAGGVQGGTSYPGSPVARQLFYRTDLEVLYVRDDDNTTWSPLGSSLSDIVFTWSGKTRNTNGNDVKLNTGGSSLVPEADASVYYFGFIGTECTSITSEDAVIFNVKFKKLASVNYLTLYANIWNASSNTTTCRLKADSLTVDVTHNTSTPTWKNGDLDITSLSNGTVYDLEIRLTSNSSTVEGYVGAVTVFAKS